MFALERKYEADAVGRLGDTSFSLHSDCFGVHSEGLSQMGWDIGSPTSKIFDVWRESRSLGAGEPGILASVIVTQSSSRECQIEKKCWKPLPDYQGRAHFQRGNRIRHRFQTLSLIRLPVTRYTRMYP